MAAAKTPQVQVVGLKVLARDLGKMTGPNGPMLKAMQQAARTAVEPVADATRSAIGGLAQAKNPPHLAGDVRIALTKTGAGVRMGRSTVRWAGWVEFGGTRRTPYRSSRPFQPQGRYMYPAARRLAGTVAARYETAIARVLDDFHWTNSGGSAHD
jgi:hypothetical protein